MKKSSAPALAESPTHDPLAVAGLFAGIGGIEVGLSTSQHHAEILCEIEPAANAVLDAHFSPRIRCTDVKEIVSLPKSIDLLSAGFPCQDLSQAGKTQGISGARSGLVGEIFRLLSRRSVEWVLLENVPFMLQLGGGRALNLIISSLEKLRYKWAYRVINSRAFGLPQRRERIYILASPIHDPRNVLLVDDVEEPVDTRSFRDVACGFYWTEGVRGLGWAIDSVPTLKGGSTIGIASPPAIIFPSGRIAKPDIRDAERMQGFLENWTKPAETVGKAGLRWKLVGNAVTVQVAEWIGRRLRRPGTYDVAGDIAIGDRWPRCAYNVDGIRYGSAVGAWPLKVATQSLEAFLNHSGDDLSARATAGFLSRARFAKLRFPLGFIAAVEKHFENVQSSDLCVRLQADDASVAL